MTNPFLTALAPSLGATGSRDPLGLQPIWARLGREVVVDVTTVSGDLRGWTTLLVGVGWIRTMIDQEHLAEAAFLDAFLRFEQLVAYSRVSTARREPPQVRGLRRVTAILDAQGERPIALNQSREWRILGGQQATGVWGQISAPARAAGLLDAKLHLTPAAAAHVARVALPVLEGFRAELLALVRGAKPFEPLRRHAELAGALATMHGRVRATEREFYTKHVLWASLGEDSLQGRLVRSWKELDDYAQPVDAPLVERLATRADILRDEALATRLRAIRIAESLLAPIEHLFGYLVGRNARRLEEVADEIEATWVGGAPVDPSCLDAIRPHALDAYVDPPWPEALFATLVEALTEPDWGRAIGALVELNEWVMRRRGSAAWLALRDGKVVVHLEGEPSTLAEAPPTWVHSYYLEQLRRLARAVEGGADAEG